jgi:methyltransferase
VIGRSEALFLLLLAAIAAERLVEFFISRRNERALRARGAREAGRSHFPPMVAVHAALFVAAPAEVLLLDRAFEPLVGGPALAVLAVAGALRIWVIRTLGPSWNVRALVAPDQRVVDTGPYRFVRHPNYLVVCLEVAAVPLVHSAFLTAIALSLLDAAILALRIPAEERLLLDLPEYRAKMAGKARLIPGLL